MSFRTYRYLAVLSMLAFVSCGSPTNSNFSFVQICDPQLGMGGYGHDVAALRQAVIQINELECDFVVVCGDLVHHASDTAFSDFLRITDGLNKPCYLVPGNHDVGNIPNDTTLGYYRSRVGRDYGSFQCNGYGFILTNTQLWKNFIEEESAAHDRWFQKTLHRMHRKGLPVFVVGHYPLFVVHPGEEEAYFNLPEEKRRELLALFVEHQVVAYLSGHKHETLLNEYMGIDLVTGESTSRNFDQRPLGFRHWEVSGDSVSHHLVPLESFGDDPQKNKVLLQKDTVLLQKEI